MDDSDRRAHWENVYSTKTEQQVSWFQEKPTVSLDLIGATNVSRAAAIIDVGGGASRLVDALVKEGYRSVTVLDVSEAALAISRARLGSRASEVEWIAADVTKWEPTTSFDVWHDRATFHFLTEAEERTAYVFTLAKALRVGGHAIIGTFALDGPERCSGLPVVRYDATFLGKTLGPAFRLIETRRQEHLTPMGGVQRFQFSRFERIE
jgi:2-polyprenyl-3-methyl-5-hydroxy-6-metoxy-1,4-benzoquinol methylase